MNPHRPFTMSDIHEVGAKKRDAWWTVLVVDPLASRIALLVANHTRITPNQLTLISFGLGIAAACVFLEGSYAFLALGAALYHISFVIDCVDGKVARLTGRGSIFGSWMDYVLDRVRVTLCALALMGGQWMATGEDIYLLLATVVVALEMLRNLNAMRVSKVRATMLADLQSAIAERLGASIDKILPALPAPIQAVALRLGQGNEGDETTGPAAGHPAEVLQQRFLARFGFYERFRNYLLRRRIRTHLMSGIEFQMATFIIGPLTSIVPVVVFSACLLVVFEIAIIYKLWLSCKDFERTLKLIESVHVDTDSLVARPSPGA